MASVIGAPHRSNSLRRRAAGDAAAYAWRRTGGEWPFLERVGHTAWVPQLLVNLFALVALVGVAASWLVRSISAGISLGWDAQLDGGPVRAMSLSGPAWMYGLVGVVILAIAVGGIPYVVKETRRRRRPSPILRLRPESLTVHTTRAVAHGTRRAKPRLREVETTFDWRDVEAVEASTDRGDARPTLVVRRAPASDLGIPVPPADGTTGFARIRIRGDARDVPVLAHYLAKARRRRELGTPESLLVAERLSTAPTSAR
ncbi:hypothetical protein [Agromyces salentinus]|uniref:Uncharacterized protein n=1 Tax=Agromyces salentinus TaxID=269421 RepID=A0ABN2MF51_9MICO|nr:hypothetical protein [Agromyces salentinus]